jgi:two-component system, OmpR family, KDP operon response regulator KdpE
VESESTPVAIVFMSDLSEMDATRILVIDDEPQIRRLVRQALGVDSAQVLEAADGKSGIDLAAAHQPDLIILDIGLPDVSGADVCREIRSWSLVPILVLSARHSDKEKAELLDLGADDYLTKPFSIVEFQARVRAQLRRFRMGKETQAVVRIESGGICIDFAKRSVARESASVHLTPIEWDLLRVLAANRGRTMTHRQLFAKVWTRSEGDAQQYLRVYIANLRRKLERDPVRPRLIITEPGVGYRFEADE